MSSLPTWNANIEAEKCNSITESNAFDMMEEHNNAKNMDLDLVADIKTPFTGRRLDNIGTIAGANENYQKIVEVVLNKQPIGTVNVSQPAQLYKKIFSRISVAEFGDTYLLVLDGYRIIQSEMSC